MKKLLLGSPGTLAMLFVLLFAMPTVARADEFDRLASSPATYWVPAPTPPPPGYAGAAGPYNYPPPYPPGYYPPPPAAYIPHFFIGFHFH